MFDHLLIHDRHERALVGVTDLLLSVIAPIVRRRSPRPEPATPQRILLLRLERIGDLLMTLDAIAMVRARAPQAEIDLTVGSWNAPLAELLPHVNRVEVMDAPWLARGGTGSGWAPLWARTRGWRSRSYDLAINFEGDIRSNILLGLSGATRRVGFAIKGGGALLSSHGEYHAAAHTSVNAESLVEHALPTSDHEAGPEPTSPRFDIPADADERASAYLQDVGATDLLVGIHASGGREIKQWDPLRFADVGMRLAQERNATLVLTGSPSDRALVDRVKAALPQNVRVIDVAGHIDLIGLGALLKRLHVFLTADTGPMHLAAAVGTPVIAILGPSSPANYGPVGRNVSVVRIDLPCSPCNRIRRPPARCVGQIPDCLIGIEVTQVLEAVDRLLPRLPQPDGSADQDSSSTA